MQLLLLRPWWTRQPAVSDDDSLPLFLLVDEDGSYVSSFRPPWTTAQPPRDTDELFSAAAPTVVDEDIGWQPAAGVVRRAIQPIAIDDETLPQFLLIDEDGWQSPAMQYRTWARLILFDDDGLATPPATIVDDDGYQSPQPAWLRATLQVFNDEDVLPAFILVDEDGAWSTGRNIATAWQQPLASDESLNFIAAPTVVDDDGGYSIAAPGWWRATPQIFGDDEVLPAFILVDEDGVWSIGQSKAIAWQQPSASDESLSVANVPVLDEDGYSSPMRGASWRQSQPIANDDDRIQPPPPFGLDEEGVWFGRPIGWWAKSQTFIDDEVAGGLLFFVYGNSHVCHIDDRPTMSHIQGRPMVTHIDDRTTVAHVQTRPVVTHINDRPVVTHLPTKH